MEKTCENCIHGKFIIVNGKFINRNVGYCIGCDHTRMSDWEPKEKSCENCRHKEIECVDNSCGKDLPLWEYFSPITGTSQPPIPDTQQKIDTLFNHFKVFLKEKNKRYGDSALSPQNIFSKQDSGSQICNRIDDKLGRIKNGTELKKNDLSDLFGYVALLLIEKDWLDFNDLLD